MNNIIFDLGGVVLKNTPLDILKKLNITDYEYNELKKFFDDWKLLDLGKMSLEDKFNACNFSLDLFNRYKDILLKYYELRDINNDLIKLMCDLKKNNYNVYILSDNNIECINYYKSKDYFDCVDGWVISCEYATLKCDGVLFDIIVDKYNLKPSECYFVDNSISNISIAKEHGMNGFKYDENDEIDVLYNDMRKNGINI